MKKIREFIGSDMFNHIAMTGPDIVRYFDPECIQTAEQKLAYAKGIMCVYPHIMMGNYCAWKYEDEPAPHDYTEFMKASIPALEQKVFPLLEKCFDSSNPLSSSERGKLIIPIITDIVPFHVLTGFYHYMYGDSVGSKDIREFVETIRPTFISLMGDIVLKSVYDDAKQVDDRVKTEVFSYIATRMPYDLLRKYHDWHFGAEVVEMGPPPGGPPPIR